MRKRWKHIGMILILSIVFGWAVTAAAADEPVPVVLRASIVPAEGVWVGQRVLYQVDVLGLNGWAKIQRMPDMQISGATVVALESQGTRLNEAIGGETYTGQRYELSLFPHRDGRIIIPPISLDIEISQWGSPPQKRIRKGSTPSVAFLAERPPGSETVSWMISTTQLSAEQRWEPDVEKVAVGEAVQRTVQLIAEDISAMAFTPITFVGNDRFDVYHRAPEVEDRYNRGTLNGRRIERVTYLFKKAGRVELPAISLTWWDLQNKKLRKTVFPPRVFDISPAATGNDGNATTPTFNGTSHYWIGVFIVLPLLMAALVRKRLQAHWTSWRLKRCDSEISYFRQFVKAARSNHPVRSFNALMRWLDRIETRDRSAQLLHFINTYADVRTAEEVDRLCEVVTSVSQSNWQGKKLIKGLIRARRSWIVQQRKLKKSDRLLPHLNPEKIN